MLHHATGVLWIRTNRRRTEAERTVSVEIGHALIFIAVGNENNLRLPLECGRVVLTLLRIIIRTFLIYIGAHQASQVAKL